MDDIKPPTPNSQPPVEGVPETNNPPVVEPTKDPITVNNPVPGGQPTAPLPPTTIQPASNTPLIITVIVLASLLVIGGIIAIVLAVAGRDNYKNDTGRVNSYSDTRDLEDDQDRSVARGSFYSDEYGFSIDFPGTPETENLTENIDGVSVPMTQYGYETDDQNAAYLVQVAVYPQDEFDVENNARAALDGAMEGMGGADGSTMIDSSEGTFLGYPSSEGTFEIKDGIRSITYETYALNFIKGNSLYTIMTVGADRSEFDSFVDSFSFN